MASKAVQSTTMRAALREYVYPVTNQTLKRDSYMDNVYRVAPDVVPENVADCLTKGLIPSKLAFGSTWQDSPAWLRRPESDWSVYHDENDDSSNKNEWERSRWMTTLAHNSIW